MCCPFVDLCKTFLQLGNNYLHTVGPCITFAAIQNSSFDLHKMCDWLIYFVFHKIALTYVRLTAAFLISFDVFFCLLMINFVPTFYYVWFSLTGLLVLLGTTDCCLLKKLLKPLDFNGIIPLVSFNGLLWVAVGPYWLITQVTKCLDPILFKHLICVPKSKLLVAVLKRTPV